MRKLIVGDVVLDTTSVYPQDVPCEIVAMWSLTCRIRSLQPVEGVILFYEIDLSSVVPYKTV